ncbi:MAG: metal ABC transporter substrate-binding protein [Oligoflexia bacterium]|nr:metal ABC transporter substrate-binding protein [Oligoflexia bacterium]
MIRVNLSLGIIIALVCWSAPLAAEPLKIVTTLPVYADLVRVIGGDLVDVSAVAPARFNPHFVEPKPSDVLRLKRADLFIHSGLDFELWRHPLTDAAGRSDLRPGGDRELDLSKFVRLLEIPQNTVTRAQGDIHIFGNPHYTLSPPNVRLIAKGITEKLSAVAPPSAAIFAQNLATWSNRLTAKEQSWRSLLAKLSGQPVIGYHNDWVYLADYTGLKIDEFLEPKPGIPPSPQHLAELQQYISRNKVRVIIQSSFYPTDSSEELASRTGARLLILCQNVGELPECPDYISMLDYDLSILAQEF